MLRRTPFNNPSNWFRNELRNFLTDWSNAPSSNPTWRRLGPRSTTGVFPAVNIYDDGESYFLRAELPGIDKDDLEIAAQENEIMIRGERKIEKPESDANYHRREREGGNFRRAVTLPKPINNNKVQATYNNGVLEIRAPRSSKASPKKIDID